MKSFLLTLGALALGAAGLAMTGAGEAREPDYVAPGRSELRLENAHVKVVENLYEPGEESALHTHEHARVVYVLDGGQLALESEDGTTSTVSLAPGQTIWRPAETHVVRNVGRTTVRVLETEVKAAVD